MPVFGSDANHIMRIISRFKINWDESWVQPEIKKMMQILSKSCIERDLKKGRLRFDGCLAGIDFPAKYGMFFVNFLAVIGRGRNGSGGKIENKYRLPSQLPLITYSDFDRKMTNEYRFLREMPLISYLQLSP